MSEIKFRAWNTAVRKMFDFSLDTLGIGVDTGSIYLRKQNIIMQFTGLKDINNKEIFEGDIVKVKNPYGKKKFSKLYPKYLNGIVKNDNGWNFYVSISEWVKEEFGFNEVQHLNPSSEDMEVLGNVYENKELLSADFSTNTAPEENKQ